VTRADPRTIVTIEGDKGLRFPSQHVRIPGEHPPTFRGDADDIFGCLLGWDIGNVGNVGDVVDGAIVDVAPSAAESLGQ
jgi:hypothetical protein